MSVHVRIKWSTNRPRRSLVPAIVVDVQVIIHQSVMQELTQMEMNWSKNGLQPIHVTLFTHKMQARKKIDTPITRKELQAARAIEIQRKKELHQAELDHWVLRNVLEPVKQAATDGHTAFQWQMQDRGKTKDDWEYIMQRIKSLFPDSDLHMISYEESTTLKNPPVNTIHWG
jgi:hypothetical protein